MSMDSAKMIEKKSIFVNENMRTSVDWLFLKISMIRLPIYFQFLRF